MRKIGIVVPKGTKYVSEIKDFELPNGILNKGIPNCGATTLALMDRHKTIVCSPRNNLLVNKHEQYGNSLLVVGGVTESEIKEYVRCAETPKILVSYDSLPKVAGCIEDKSDWRVVADEFQYLLSDSGFKSEVEHRFMVYFLYEKQARDYLCEWKRVSLPYLPLFPLQYCMTFQFRL